MNRTKSGTVAVTLFVAASLVALAGSASAALVISNAATNNVTCTGGVCSPSGPGPVLNAGDLQNMLAAGDTTVAMPLNDIKIGAPVTWASGSRLTLDAHRSLFINRPISVTGAGALTITINDGGTGGDYVFAGTGHVTFANLSSSLIINGISYTLINTVAGLASAAAANPNGSYALAQSYDALADGFYPTSPVPGIFSGRFEGLANKISRLRVDINVSGVTVNAGLFDTLDTGTSLRDLHMPNALVKLTITGHGPNGSSAGIAAGDVAGEIAYVTTSGSIQTHIAYPIYTGGLIGHLAYKTVRDSSAAVTVNAVSSTHVAYSGGLIGWAEYGTVLRSSATGAVTSQANVQGTYAAGLIGRTDGVTLSQSWASGASSATGNIEAMAGGLLGQELGGSVTDSYALGNSFATVSSHNVFAGGLIAETISATTTTSYSTGSATTSGGSIHLAGGFIGEAAGTSTDDYWDTDTSGMLNATGSGSNAGITGLSNAALLAAVPSGFSASVWAQSPAINNGYPYLINNAP